MYKLSRKEFDKVKFWASNNNKYIDEIYNELLNTLKTNNYSYFNIDEELLYDNLTYYIYKKSIKDK
jgi:Txe/YoeB family toxin of Txe-Axe toxin-antitoxin module